MANGELKFPGDFALSDLICGLKISRRLATERKRQHTTELHRHMDILAKISGVTHSDTASLRLFRIAVAKARTNLNVLKEIAEDAGAHNYCAQLQDAVHACWGGSLTAAQVKLVDDMKIVKAAYVIVWELFLLLIPDDLDVDEEEALNIYEESSRVVPFEDPDERSLHSDSDSDTLLVPRTTSERLLAAMAAKRRQEIRAEEGKDTDTGGSSVVLVSAVKAEPEDARIPEEGWSMIVQEEDGKMVYIID
ncbi:hypothetical protein AURDEDRAFT_129870 [Auricularia subglabra TFB-10046 SS5]|nr:hypothetical protein AURDEDRAFT_129870 [Auricularia subglabra TFB-10046 SS5]